jgi:hypothetical protein
LELVLVKFEFELKSTASTAKTSAATERIETLLKRIEALILLLFGIKRIFAIVKFGSFFLKE